MKIKCVLPHRWCVDEVITKGVFLKCLDCGKIEYFKSTYCIKGDAPI